MKYPWTVTGVLVLLVALAGVGCGGSSNDSAVPPELVGSFTTTLKSSDLPADPPAEINDAGMNWTLTIAETGAADGGPVLAIGTDTQGNLESSSLRVEGDKLLIDHEVCAASGSTVSYDNEYLWALEGGTLTISPKVNQCEDDVALTILTSQPWKKAT